MKIFFCQDMSTEQDQSQNIDRLQPNAGNTECKFFCSHCSFKTKRHSQFLIHMRSHKDGTEKTYHCKKCDFVSLSLSYLKRHEMKHNENLFRYAGNMRVLLRKLNLEDGDILDKNLFISRNQSMAIKHFDICTGVGQFFNSNKRVEMHMFYKPSVHERQT